jgi:hypothetical protein
MDLPIKFPSETEVILEDVGRFRARSPVERMRTICELLAEGEYLSRRSPKAAWIVEDYEEQGRLKRQSVKEFIKRHAR